MALHPQCLIRRWWHEAVKSHRFLPCGAEPEKVAAPLCRDINSGDNTEGVRHASCGFSVQHCRRRCFHETIPAVWFGGWPLVLWPPTLVCQPSHGLCELPGNFEISNCSVYISQIWSLLLAAKYPTQYKNWSQILGNLSGIWNGFFRTTCNWRKENSS